LVTPSSLISGCSPFSAIDVPLLSVYRTVEPAESAGKPRGGALRALL
jgi:hypothetical protein